MLQVIQWGMEIPKKGQAQAYLGKRGNMGMYEGSGEKNGQVNTAEKIAWHMVLWVSHQAVFPEADPQHPT